MAYKNKEMARAKSRDYMRAWRKRTGRGRSKPMTSAEMRNQHLKKLYGINSKEFDDLLERQGGSCWVCSGPPMGKGQYHVDHCHETKQIRGLLCHKCNVALGMVGDSIEHLSRLIFYLQYHQAESSVTLMVPVAESQMASILPV